MPIFYTQVREIENPEKINPYIQLKSTTYTEAKNEVSTLYNGTNTVVVMSFLARLKCQIEHEGPGFCCPCSKFVNGEWGGDFIIPEDVTYYYP